MIPTTCASAACGDSRPAREPLHRGLLAATLLLALAACSGPPSHFTRLWPRGVQGQPVVGLSTDEGVLVLADTSYRLGDLFDVQFPVGNSRVDEVGELIRINDNLGVIQPLTARLAEGRLAATPDQPHEQLYVAVRDGDDDPVMCPVERWRGGVHGDLVVSPESDVEAFAQRYAGTGVYVYRDDHWQIVGMLSGLVVATADPNVPDDDATSIGYIGLDELRRAVSDGVDYVRPSFLPRRTDFEFGVERQPDDVPLDELRRLNPDAPKKAPTKPAPGAATATGAEGPRATDAPATTPSEEPAGDATTIDFLELLREAEQAAGAAAEGDTEGDTDEDAEGEPDDEGPSADVDTPPTDDDGDGDGDAGDDPSEPDDGGP